MDEGGNLTYTLHLDRAPEGVVTVNLQSDNPDILFIPPDLTFTADDWREARTVTVLAAEDDDLLDESGPHLVFRSRRRTGPPALTPPSAHPG